MRELGNARQLCIILVLSLSLTGCNVLRMLVATGSDLSLKIKPSDTRGCLIDEITYQSDGISVVGWIIRPEAEGPHPLLVLNHGYAYGIVERQYFERDTSPFIYRGCMLARRGYVVFFSHYRGFGKSGGRQTFGPGELRDVIAGIELMKARPYVDPGRIGLAGDSEGAMISLFIASMRADIDCVVAVSAPVELGRMFKGYPSWMRRVASVPGLYDAIGGTPEEVPHEYRERSALYVAHRISSPVLIIHGGRDPIVPVEQAYLLDKALRRAGILHETLILPQATHGIFTGREKDEIAELVWNRADGFLDRHLLK